MHRKKIRRWHKLLSVSGIIVAVFGMLYVPAANAQLGGPTPDGIYGPSYSKDDIQMLYLDFPNNIVGLETSDLYITGTSTGCVIDPIPAVTAFSFGVWVRGCSDGFYNVNLKAESIAYQNGKTGPDIDYLGSQITVDRTNLTLQFINVPLAVSSASFEWQVAFNHPIVYTPYYNISLGGAGCGLQSTSPTSYGLSIVVYGCLPGANATLIFNAQAIQDRYGTLGPQTTTTSPTVLVNYSAPAPLPSPTPALTPTASPSLNPTASPMPSVSPSLAPTASPTITPSVAPTSNPSPSDPPASVAVINPPTDPPAPPAAIQPEPAPPVVSDPAPTIVETESTVSLAPIPVTRAKIVQVRKAIAKTEVVELPEEAVDPVITNPPIVMPAIETEVRPSFNWQPIGYLALAVGGAAAAVGGGLLLQRMARVRRLKFS